MAWHRLVASFLGFVSAVAALLLSALAVADQAARHVLALLGLAGGAVQTFVLLVVAVLVLAAALRFLGGIVSVLIAVIVVLFAIHLLLPGLHV